MTAEQPAIPLDRISAVVFDTDGVVIDSARVHAAAWKRSFDEFLRRRNREAGAQLRPFDIRTDYLHHLHGQPHMDGVRAFLASRGITLPDGTARAIAARATRYFLQEIDRYGVAAFRSAVTLVREVRGRGAPTAAFSPSPHCARVLAAAKVQKLFDLRVDASITVGLDPTARPEAVLLLETARRLDLPPRQLAVVADSLAGVEAARRAEYGLVIAVARDPDPPRRDWAATLRARGAQIVVRDLAELAVVGRRRDVVVLDP
ncbi:HAD family hydrolase [Actinopolymorpha sp. B11F2]|uniref:HAD family hydrolase n=1 Tax=Actinopolymorpha sp. B11F2 TaxID=3160862 RepID=UPI0032E4550B